MFNINKITDFNLKNKRILMRLDLNVPLYQNKILSDARIISSLPTINYAIQEKAKIIILMSHLGRPKEGEYNENLSLLPIVNYLQKKFPNIEVELHKSNLNKINFNNKKLRIIVLENVRFNIGELSNNDNLSRSYSKLCDIFVMDAFGTIHRKQSSTYGICKFAKNVCAGFLLTSELKNIKKILKNPIRPMVAIVGGSKISSKFNLLSSLSKIADYIIVGGGIANTFISVNNKIGKSLYEPNFVKLAKSLISSSNFIIPEDYIVSSEFSENAKAIPRHMNDIKENEMIMDIGENTSKKLIKLIKNAKTILWNGPLGVYEFSNFRQGTKMIAEAIINSKAFSIAGGGDTLAIIELLKIKNKISYISTGGGAFLEMVSGKKLPVIEILKKRFQKIN